MNKKYRMKNKKRFMSVMVALVTVILCMSSILAVQAIPKDEDTQTVSIMPGDTLWTIAQEYHGNMEIRQYIYKIKKLNKLSDSMIFTGQVLRIP